MIASQVYDIGRLWYLTVLLAVALPPAGAWLWRRNWQFTIGTMLAIVFLVSIMLAWLLPVFGELKWYLRDYQGSLSHSDWELPFLAGLCSSLATWAVCRQPDADSDEETE